MPTEVTFLRIDGMHCAACAERVERALTEVGGVATASVDLDACRAEVAGSGFPVERLLEAVAEAGYTAAPEPR